MDDAWILNHQLWDIDREFETNLPEYIHFEVDHKVALVNGGDMWDVANLQVLCIECHKKKTREDLKKRKGEA
jgi:5-methylcytosine-specific restriction endonuclease McrA